MAIHHAFEIKFLPQRVSTLLIEIGLEIVLHLFVSFQDLFIEIKAPFGIAGALIKKRF